MYSVNGLAVIVSGPDLTSVMDVVLYMYVLIQSTSSPMWYWMTQ